VREIGLIKEKLGDESSGLSEESRVELEKLIDLFDTCQLEKSSFPTQLISHCIRMFLENPKSRNRGWILDGIELSNLEVREIWNSGVVEGGMVGEDGERDDSKYRLPTHCFNLEGSDAVINGKLQTTTGKYNMF